MSRDFRITTSVPSRSVVEALGESLKEWRESAIPAAVRDQGALRVTGSLTGNRFVLAYDHRYRPYRFVRVTGSVVDGPNGGAVVIGRVGATTYPLFLAPVFLAGGLLDWFRDGVAGPLLVGVGAALVIGEWLVRTRSGSDPASLHLVAHLEAVVARIAGEPGVVALNGQGHR